MKRHSVKSHSQNPQKRQQRKNTKSIFECTDIYNVPVHLSRPTWEEHIKPKHPEVEPYLDVAKTAIEDPHVVSVDTQQEETKIFSRMELGKGIYKDQYFRAVVQYSGGGGRIATMFFDKSLPPGKIIWVSKSTEI